MSKQVLVTGAGGFIGRHVAGHLAAAGLHVVGTFHRRHSGNTEGVIRNPGESGEALDSVARPNGLARNDIVGEWRRLQLEDPEADLGAVCRDVEAVVHLAAHVHVGPVSRIFSRERFQEVNAAGTERLAQAAIRQGVKHFIYLGSVGVHGADSPAEGDAFHRFTESDPPVPNNDYARSKLEGESRLQALCRNSAMSFTILRVPLVFGPGVGANFRRLMHAIAMGLPLPLKDVRAQRSVLYVEHLAEIIVRCIGTPAARGALFLVSDHDHEIETLVRGLAEAMQRPVRLWHCPGALDRMLSSTPMLGGAWRSLTRPLLVNSARLREALSWSPSVAPDEALRRTAAAYLGSS